MIRKPFKVVIRKENDPELREVKGYFTWLNDLRVFIYYDFSYRLWYVIDLDTGLSIASGRSMTEAKKATIERLDLFKNIKKDKKYKTYKFQYQKMLKEERNEVQNEISSN